VHDPVPVAPVGPAQVNDIGVENFPVLFRTMLQPN
jgi:hypothetical protein